MNRKRISMWARKDRERKIRERNNEPEGGYKSEDEANPYPDIEGLEKPHIIQPELEQPKKR